MSILEQPVDAAPVDTALVEPTRVRRSLSPSRAADFRACPLMYRFRTVDRLPEAPDQAATRGTLVHAVLEDLYGLPAHQRTPERARAMVAPRWARLRVDEPRLGPLLEAGSPEEARWLASAEALLEAYFTLEDPRRLEPAERESRVEHVLASGLGLTGIIDRVDVAPDGRVRLVDYKTGRSPGERHEDRALFQMRFYALVLWRTRGVVPTLLQLLYLGDRTVLSYEPTEDELLAVERTLQALWSAVDTALTTGEFLPRRSALCRWCGHQDLCPEYGGTTPPMPVVELVEPGAPRD